MRKTPSCQTTSGPGIEGSSKGETSVAQAARQHGLRVAEVENRQDQYLRPAENGLRRRPKDEEALKDAQIKKLQQKIGELLVENDM